MHHDNDKPAGFGRWAGRPPEGTTIHEGLMLASLRLEPILILKQYLKTHNSDYIQCVAIKHNSDKNKTLYMTY